MNSPSPLLQSPSDDAQGTEELLARFLSALTKIEGLYQATPNKLAAIISAVKGDRQKLVELAAALGTNADEASVLLQKISDDQVLFQQVIEAVGKSRDAVGEAASAAEETHSDLVSVESFVKAMVVKAEATRMLAKSVGEHATATESSMSVAESAFAKTAVKAGGFHASVTKILEMIVAANKVADAELKHAEKVRAAADAAGKNATLTEAQSIASELSAHNAISRVNQRCQELSDFAGDINAGRWEKNIRSAVLAGALSGSFIAQVLFLAWANGVDIESHPLFNDGSINFENLTGRDEWGGPIIRALLTTAIGGYGLAKIDTAQGKTATVAALVISAAVSAYAFSQGMDNVQEEAEADLQAAAELARADIDDITDLYAKRLDEINDDIGQVAGDDLSELRATMDAAGAEVRKLEQELSLFDTKARVIDFDKFPRLASPQGTNINNDGQDPAGDRVVRQTIVAELDAAKASERDATEAYNKAASAGDDPRVAAFLERRAEIVDERDTDATLSALRDQERMLILQRTIINANGDIEAIDTDSMNPEDVALLEQAKDKYNSVLRDKVANGLFWGFTALLADFGSMLFLEDIIKSGKTRANMTSAGATAVDPFAAHASPNTTIEAYDFRNETMAEIKAMQDAEVQKTEAQRILDLQAAAITQRISEVCSDDDGAKAIALRQLNERLEAQREVINQADFSGSAQRMKDAADELTARNDNQGKGHRTLRPRAA